MKVSGLGLTLNGAGACVALVLSLVAVVPAHGQTLEEELAGLIVNSPEILSREKSYQAAIHGVDRAFAGYLPRLDATGESGP